MIMGLLDLPYELIILTTSLLDDANDKAAFRKKCRRVHKVTKSHFCRFLVVDGHANVAIYAALTGATIILDLPLTYNRRFINRLWEHRSNLRTGSGR